MNRRELEDYTHAFLIKILPEIAADAVMGNIARESDFDPTLVEVGSGVGFGLCQWSYTRRTQLESYGTDIGHQLLFLQDELMGTHNSSTAEFQWIDKSGYLSHSKFIKGDGTLEELTKAFCFCWERPNYELSHIDERIQCAKEYYERYSSGSGGGGETDANAKIIESAVQFMIDVANDDSHGYDQDNRWGNPDYDCSSLVISAYTQAGIDVKGAGATFTGNMKEVFTYLGFEVVVPSDWSSTSEIKRGDVLLNEVHHTAMYIGDGQIAQASINENGDVRGGQPGDQTGKEILIRSYYVYSKGWDCILRLPTNGTIGGGGGGSTSSDIATKDNIIEMIEKYDINNCYNLVKSYRPSRINSLTSEEVTALKSAVLGLHCHLKHTWDKNKRRVGVSFCGGHLTFTERQYIINNVDRTGLIILHSGSKRNFIKLNPKYIFLTDEDLDELINYVNEIIKESEEKNVE